MDLEILNKVNCYLFPNDEVHSHFIIGYRLITTVKNMCLAHNKQLLNGINNIIKTNKNVLFVDFCNNLMSKLTYIISNVSPEYILFKSFNVPYIEKDNFVIISSYSCLSKIEYFSFPTGELIRTINTSHTDIRTILRINNILVSCSGGDEKNFGLVQLFDITSGTSLQNIKYDNVQDIASNNNMLAITNYNNTILYDIINNTIFHTFDIEGPVCLTKDVIVGWKDGYIIIINLKTQLPIWKIESEETPIIIIYNDLLIYGGDGDNYYIMIFNIKTMKMVRVLKGHTLGISSLLINNNILISGSIDNTIKFWNIESGLNIKTLKGHDERITSLAIKDNYLISGDWNNNILIWDLNTYKIVKTIKTAGWVSSLMLVNLKYASIN